MQRPGAVGGGGGGGGGASTLPHLQANPAGIRNICVIAHVDHGKTTLVDNLLTSVGIISDRMAGKLRYLDSLPDEQLRGITMKSSAISLRFYNNRKEYLVNVIDTPGHVDFAGEVSTAVRLCDGACILIDAVEGVCPQTKAVLRQIWIEGSKPCLVINKLDRLICELKMTTSEAHEHLKRILEQVNAFMGELFGAGVIRQANLEQGLKDDSHDDQHVYFSPEKNNVVFGSALDGWAFRICDFAKIYSKKMGMSESSLQATLWGDFYLDTKKKRLSKGAFDHGKKPLFEQFILDSIWSIYENIIIKKDEQKIEKIYASLNITMDTRDVKAHDQRVHLKALMSQWLPLAYAVLEMVINKLPSCEVMKDERIKNLLYTAVTNEDTDSTEEMQRMKKAFRECDSSNEAPVIVYISKMATVNKKFLRPRRVALSAEEMKERSEQAKLRHKQRMEAKKAEVAAKKLQDEQDEIDSHKKKSSRNNKGKNNDQESKLNPPSQENRTNDKSSNLAQSNTSTKTDENSVSPSITTLPTPLANPSTSTSDSSITPCIPTTPVVDEDADVFIAFARVFSGTLKRGQKLLVLSPKYDPFTTIKKFNGRYKLSDLSDSEIRSLHNAKEVEIGQLYMFMGMEMLPLDTVPAGNIVGIAGLNDHVINSGALSDSLCCTSFSRMYVEAKSILRVAVEPKMACDMAAVVKGLRLLNQADAWVNVTEERSGELVISTAGQVHLEKCINDLTQNFAKVQVNVSDPIVPFRETIVWPPVVDAVNEAIDAPVGADSTTTSTTTTGTTTTTSVQGSNSNSAANRNQGKNNDESSDNATFKPTLMYRGVRYNVLALPLSDETSNLIECHKELIISCSSSSSSSPSAPALAKDTLEDEEDDTTTPTPTTPTPNTSVPSTSIDAAPTPTTSAPTTTSIDADPAPSSTTTTGASRSSPEQPTVLGYSERGREFKCKLRVALEADLANNDRDFQVDDILSFGPEKSLENMLAFCGDQVGFNVWGRRRGETSDQELYRVLINGFMMATEAGPLCDEPLRGVCFIVKKCEDEQNQCDANDSKGAISLGKLISNMRACFQQSLQTCDVCIRIVIAMNTCVIQTDAETLGKLYASLAKRGGRVISEELTDSWSTFNVVACVPMADSFEFAAEIRKKTSGLANPSMKFSHWQVLHTDPFWVPTTDEEYRHFGSKADTENAARRYMNTVRRRKGLQVAEHIVEFAEKQRNLTRNK